MGEQTNNGGVWFRWVAGAVLGVVVALMGYLLSDSVNTRERVSAMESDQAAQRRQLDRMEIKLDALIMSRMNASEANP